jgi:hypothetical protein
VFALEHGLSTAELMDLREYLTESLRSEPLALDERFLPWVVHAAEVGYTYEGDEFWRSFAASTVDWVAHGDRRFLRQCFQRFADRYHGVVPKGIFARHFSIIAWPIRHALLPRDLQLHFARTLFELRHVFETAGDELSPESVGRQISLRAHEKSTRFARFCDDHHLVGEIAVAVLTGMEEGHDASSIHRPTLERVVQNIEEIREGNDFLERARDGYRKWRNLYAGGSRPRSSSLGNSTLDAQVRLYLRRSADENWSTWIRLPHLDSLDEATADFRNLLRRARVHLRGQDQSILGARLLHPNQSERIDRWPGIGPLLQTEDGSELGGVLASVSEVPAGPPWLFKLRDDSEALLLKSNDVRPGSEYVVLTDQDDPPMQEHLTLAGINTEGVRGYRIDVPRPVPELLKFRLSRLGLALQRQVRIQPVGFVPPSWDHEGMMEVLSTEPTLLHIETDSELKSIAVESEGNRWEVTTDGMSAILSLGRVRPGRTNLDLTLHFAEDEESTHCALTLYARVPRIWGSRDAAAGALLLETSPPDPSLEEFWDDTTRIWLDGPRGAMASVELNLTQYDGTLVPVRVQERLPLPIAPESFSAFRNTLTRKDSFVGKLDYSEKCEVIFESPEAGIARVPLDREATALRWAVAFQGRAPNLALVDNSDADSLAVCVYRVDAPFSSTSLTLKAGAATRRLEVTDAEPGLYVARTTLERVGVIIPPAGSKKSLKLSELRADVERPKLARGQSGISEALTMLADWSAGRPGGNRLQASLLQASVITRLAEAVMTTVASNSLGGVVRIFRDANSAEMALTELERTAGASKWLEELEDLYEYEPLTLDARDREETISALSRMLVKTKSFGSDNESTLRVCLEICDAALRSHSISGMADHKALSRRLLEDARVLNASTYLLLRAGLDAY